MKKILEVNNLQISFPILANYIEIIRGVDFYVNNNETLCLVGESGSGKSVTAQSLLGLLSDRSLISGKINFYGKDLNSSSTCWEKLRGQEISMIFQNPFKALNPTMTIGKQIGEMLVIHQGYSKKQAKNKVLEFLDLVRIPQAKQRYTQYPFEFSGGMLQRVMIALAIICRPKLLIADEPTTALDVTLQRQILDLLKQIQKEFGMSILFITHDLGVVAQLANRVNVMYGGKIVEDGSVSEIFNQTQHPYTKALLNALPTHDGKLRKSIESIAGSPPNLHQKIKGCSFADRCQEAMNICIRELPEKKQHSLQHSSVCWKHWSEDA